MDFITDENPRPLHRAVANGYEFPKYAAEGTWPGEEDVANLTAAAFADTGCRQHPIHTKAACLVSTVYVVNSGADVEPAVLERLKTAAELFGIEADVLPLLADYTSRTKQASQRPEQYALRDNADAFYPTGTRYDLERSSLGILEDRRRENLPIKLARQAAVQLIKRASELQYDPNLFPEEIQKLGSETLLNPDALEAQADWRQRLTGNDLYKQAAAFYREAPTEQNRQDVAQAWEDLDRAHGVKVSRLTPSLVSCFFDGVDLHTVKEAAKGLVWFGNETVPTGTLSLIPKSVYSGWYGSDMQEKVAAVFDASTRSGLEASELLETWTQDERALLAQHLQRHHA